MSIRKAAILISRLAAKSSHVDESVLHILSVLPEAEEVRRSHGRPLAVCLARRLVYTHRAYSTLFDFSEFLQRLEYPVFVFDSYRIRDLATPFQVRAVQRERLVAKRTIASLIGSWTRGRVG